MPRNVIRVAGVVLAGAALAGCGSSAHANTAALFRSDCQACHSISGRATPRQQGGDLRYLHLPRAELEQYIAEMPVLHRAPTRAQVRALAAYLQKLEQRG